MNFSLKSAMLAGVAYAVVAPAPALAQSIAFDIPARDLGGALQQFALTSNQEILYSPALVADRRTQGVSGSYTPEDALRRLLNGTDLHYRRTSPGSFVVERNGGSAIARTTPVALQASGTVAQPVNSAPAATGQGSLSGTFYDQATGTPIAGARVAIEGTGLTANTDERGIYRFPAIASGNYVVTLEYLGDAPLRESVAVTPGSPSRFDFVRPSGDGSIVVLGYTSAIQQALNQQRTASNNSTVVSEDLLGGFPAETVSEALRRVPGVAFGRDADTGEGSRITVRGFSSEAINVQVNGLDLQGTNFERTIDLSGYLAENISTITIHKSLLPSHEATGSGGLVEIETRSGLDYGDFHFSANVEGERAWDSGFGNEWQAGGTIGAKLTDNLGIVGTISYRDTNRSNYDVGVLGYTPAVLPAGFTSITLVPASYQFPFDDEFNNRLINTGNYGVRDRDETTLAASVNLAWDIGDHTRLRFDVQRNERDAVTFLTRSSVTFLPLTTLNVPIPELGGEVRRRMLLNSFRPSLTLTSNDLNLTTNTVSLRGDTDVGRWQFRYKGGYTGARSRSQNSSINLLGNTYTNITDLIDPSTIVTAPDSANTPRVIDGAFILLPNGVPVPSMSQLGIDTLLDPATYRVNTAIRTMTDSPTDAWVLEGSARYSPDTWLDYVELGGKYDRSKRTAVDDLFATTSTGTLASTESYISIASAPTYMSDLTSVLFGNRSLADIGVNFAIPSMNAAGRDALFDVLAGLTADDPSTAYNERRFNYNDFRDRDPILDSSAMSPAGSTEERLATYLETHVEFGKFDAIAGARMERVKRTGNAIILPSVTLPVGTEPRETFIAAGLIDFVDTVATDTTITPSFLLNYRPQSNIVARFGYFRSTVAPNLQQLRRQTQYILNFRTNRMILREGNPDLKPTTTDNFDFDVAYYFRDAPGLVRAGLFYKKTSNNFTNLLIQDQPGDTRQRLLDYLAPLAGSRPDLVDFNDDTEFLLSRPVNGEGGKIWGFELELIRQFDFLPGILGGFGVIGNLTYTSGDFPTLVSGRLDDGTLTSFSLDRPLEDQAAWVYNAALTYSRGGLEGRLIYTRQSQTVTTYEIHDLNSVIPAYSTLDLRLSYSFDGPWGGLVTLFLEGDDLLHDGKDPDIRSATANTPGREDARFFFPNTFQFNGGRTFTAGARVRF